MDDSNETSSRSQNIPNGDIREPEAGRGECGSPTEAVTGAVSLRLGAACPIGVPSGDVAFSVCLQTVRSPCAAASGCGYFRPIGTAIGRNADNSAGSECYPTALAAGLKVGIVTRQHVDGQRRCQRPSPSPTCPGVGGYKRAFSIRRNCNDSIRICSETNTGIFRELSRRANKTR